MKNYNFLLSLALIMPMALIAQDSTDDSDIEEVVASWCIKSMS